MCLLKARPKASAQGRRRVDDFFSPGRGLPAPDEEEEMTWKQCGLKRDRVKIRAM
jgi:hypothetical protein